MCWEVPLSCFSFQMYSDEGHLSYVVICVCKWVVEVGHGGEGGGENNAIVSKWFGINARAAKGRKSKR